MRTFLLIVAVLLFSACTPAQLEKAKSASDKARQFCEAYYSANPEEGDSALSPEEICNAHNKLAPFLNFIPVKDSDSEEQNGD